MTFLNKLNQGYAFTDSLQNANFLISNDGSLTVNSAFQALTVKTQKGLNISPPYNNAFIVYNNTNDVSGSHSWSNQGTIMGLGKNQNGRSINTTGTVNTNGTDYAEYMYKSGEFTVNKGDIIGLNKNGKLTNLFGESITFMVKSTNPSFVGGDEWSSSNKIGFIRTEENSESFDLSLNQIRQQVDRIAFCGQVPVNILGANVGDYIIPIPTPDGFITGISVSNANVTFEQYKMSVGKVIEILEDGRAKIIVKS
jgi:hypothetical protein